jgi:hypothetical protein
MGFCWIQKPFTHNVFPNSLQAMAWYAAYCWKTFKKACHLMFNFLFSLFQAFDVGVKKYMMGKTLREVVAIMLEHAPAPITVEKAIGMNS